ncbi:MAG: PIN domain-containing protein [Candidatus Woesearchaeota archaeon]|nr:PIN domain-containing protein [Candidatus Woesearchaeota archaeon]
MDLVVDANILFAVLIRSGKTEELIFEPELHLFAPEFIFKEFEKYTQEILQKTNRTIEEFQELLDILQTRIKTMSNEATESHLQLAIKCCPDRKDADYFAIALKLHCAIWSNDQQLKKQELIKIYTTKELIELFSK